MARPKRVGWVAVHRQLWDNPTLCNPNYLVVWLWILTHAEYNDPSKAESITWKGETRKLKKGEFTFGAYRIAEETGVSRGSTERAIQRFISEEQIEVLPSHSFSLGFVKNWEKYQPHRGAYQALSEEPTEELSEDIYKNNKNIKKKEEKNTELIAPATASAEIVSVFEVFKVLAAPNYGNKTHRKAVEEMIGSYTFEKTLAAAKYAVSIQNEKYAPMITNPYQLKAKFGELVAFKARQDKSPKSLVAEI